MKDSPAFPFVNSPDSKYNKTGLTKREWFAGMVLSGMDIGKFSPDETAHFAFLFADAMIAEGEKT